MKYLLTLLIGFSLSCYAQDGALNLTILNNPTLGPLEMSVFLKGDSTNTWVGVTDEYGQVITKNLPQGMQTLQFVYLGKEYGTRDFFVQERQLLSTTVLIDTVLAGIQVNQYGKYEIGAGGEVGTSGGILVDGNLSVATITRYDIARMPVSFAAEVQSIQEVSIVSYKTP